MAIIGIDLGTSNSAAALRDGRPVIIPSTAGLSLGGKVFPSYELRAAVRFARFGCGHEAALRRGSA